VQFASSLAGPRRQLEGLQFLPSSFAPQPLFTAQAFVERDGLQLIHNPRPRLHHAVAMPKQLPQIINENARPSARHSRKAPYVPRMASGSFICVAQSGS
jgi:hypothetical protein